ncbi:hypothetical protein PAHAL_7G289700 [Panicum hallii]|uniref:Uncharacterized protein n=1 Tax=Panicum hallii TaxID=206008 RepID=A0A2S3IAA8_9POAL|nr:hypothetical protein PAHAL_7G289700 [Panicum hallii]
MGSDRPREEKALKCSGFGLLLCRHARIYTSRSSRVTSLIMDHKNAGFVGLIIADFRVKRFGFWCS